MMGHKPMFGRVKCHISYHVYAHVFQIIVLQYIIPKADGRAQDFIGLDSEPWRLRVLIDVDFSVNATTNAIEL